MKALYLTADTIGAPTGGGKVTFHERLAIQEAGYEVEVHGGERPSVYRSIDVPYLDDHFAARLIDPGFYGLVHAYSGTFSASLRRIDDYRHQANMFRNNLDTWQWKRIGGRGDQTVITMTVPAHNRRITVENWERQHGPGSYPYGHIKDPDLWAAFSEGIRLADKVIVPSTHSRDALLEEGIAPDKLVIIPHGIEAVPTDYAPLPTDRFKVGAMGQITGPDKSIQTLIQAWGALGYNEAECWLAGRGSETLEPLIRRYAPKGKFRLLGYIEDPAMFYNNVNVVCAPSMTEAFNIGVMEALSYGRPVVVSTGAGASDIVSANPVCGQTFPAGNVEALTDILGGMHSTSLMDDPDIEKRRELARQFTWEAIRPRYIALWRSLP